MAVTHPGGDKRRGYRGGKSPAENQKAYRLRHPEKVRAANREHMRRYNATPHGKRMKKNIALMKLYGITIDEFEELAKKQKTHCGICGRFLDLSFYTHVDHCHTTGKVRGLLCSTCNAALGCFCDSVSMLKRAIAYLERSK